MTEKPKLAEVKTLYDGNLRDVAYVLRKIADGIDNGSYGQVKQATLVMLNGRGLEVFGLGKVDARDVHYMLAAGSHIMIEPLLEYEGGELP